MSRSTERARVESYLATAHRVIYYAAQAAARMQDEGMEDDLLQLLGEIARLAEASLRDKPSKTIPGQTQLV